MSDDDGGALVDPRTLRSLEYDKIRELLAAETACSLGKARVAALAASASREEVGEWLSLTTEARRAMEDFGPFPFGGLTDVSNLARRAGVGAVLGGGELNQVGDALRCTRRVREHAERIRDDCQRLSRIGAHLHEYAELESAIRDSLNDEGEVMDSASPELTRLRRQVRRLRDKILGEIDKIVASPALGRLLRERLPTVRSGRYCIPIKSQFQGQFGGIVHDRSDSGATVFMEPEAVVGLGNDLRQAEFDEQKEVERILEELSGSVGARAEDILVDLDTLAELDLISAKARLSAVMDAAPPDLDETGYLCLIKARHPLLTGDVVPIDVYLGREFSALLITGPNTGGKTVTLKTVGLLCLMAQSGLHIPADLGSRVPVYRQVFADIGDEQSIEQSLSTFSSHMTQIVSILRRMDHDALV
ncbi:MAG: endonuclease MutS2, partial [Armatimonadota bacterium]